MSSAKWRLVRMFETLARLLKPLMPPLPPVEDPSTPPGSILVVEYWNLGDLAILVPFLKNLRRAFPGARISLLLHSGRESLLDEQGIVDEFIPARVPWARHFHRWRKYNPFSLDWIRLTRTIFALRKRRFDWALSGRMDVRDNFILWLSGARRRIAYGLGGGGALLTDRVMPDLSHPHRADVWLHLLEAANAPPMNVPLDRKLPRLQLKDSDLASARSYFEKLAIPAGASLVGIHAGARIATRRWGYDRFAEVARRLLRETDAHILWFSEPGSFFQAPPLQRCHGVSVGFRSFLALLSQCRLLVCNDSGPMHLANLLGIPLVAVFGPQRPEWFGPRGPRDRVVIRPEFPCRPCFDYCIFDKPYCLRAVTVDEVYAAVASQMNDIRKSKTGRIPIVHTESVARA
jgi:heptosyltransferase-2